MRFGTKILLLTLAITLGLGALVAIAVRSEITDRETARALQDIRAAADDYFQRLDAMQDRVGLVVHREMEDPNNKSLLDAFSMALSSGPRQEAQAQFDGVIFRVLAENDLNFGGSVAPAFQVLLDSAGQLLVAWAADEGLKTALQSQPIDWRIKPMLPSDKPARQYLLIGGKLYLAFGIPIRQTAQEDPRFAYFGGFAITDEWTQRLLPQRGDVSVSAWFIVDQQVIARASEPSAGAQVWKALLQRAGGDPKPQERRTISFDVVGEPFVGEQVSFEPAANVRGMLALASSLYDALAPLRRLRREIAFITLFSMVLATAAARLMARRLARPVEELVAGTHRIARGDFRSPINSRRRDELGTLARSLDEMAIELIQRDLIKHTLGQFVDPRIADALITHPDSLRGQRLMQSVLFSDLENFTSLSERLSPEALVELLNRYLGTSADVVKSSNGYLDKFTGDGVIAFWGPPVEANHSVAACRAALNMVELSKQFTDPPLRVRIGIATGEVLVGIIGSESSKKNYTAMGDVVNLASRLEGANKVYGTQILVDGRTAGEVKGSLATRMIDVVRVVGRVEPVELYEVLAERGEPDGRYDQAMAHYRSRRWPEARDGFSQIGEPAARVMADRCSRFLHSAPDPAWDGVWNLDAK